jgi:hypothetical protein
MLIASADVQALSSAFDKFLDADKQGDVTAAEQAVSTAVKLHNRVCLMDSMCCVCFKHSDVFQDADVAKMAVVCHVCGAAWCHVDCLKTRCINIDNDRQIIQSAPATTLTVNYKNDGHAGDVEDDDDEDNDDETMVMDDVMDDDMDDIIDNEHTSTYMPHCVTVRGKDRLLCSEDCCLWHAIAENEAKCRAIMASDGSRAKIAKEVDVEVEVEVDVGQTSAEMDKSQVPAQVVPEPHPSPPPAEAKKTTKRPTLTERHMLLMAYAKTK